jgi:hypothetical protein
MLRKALRNPARSTANRTGSAGRVLSVRGIPGVVTRCCRDARVGWEVVFWDSIMAPQELAAALKLAP